MYSSAVVSCAAKTTFMSAFTRSTVSCSPSSSSSSPRISARRSRSRHASIAASAARCARRIPASCASVFARRRSSKSSWSTSSSTPSARRRSASQTGKFSGTLARFKPEAADGPQRELRAELAAVDPRRDQLVVAELLGHVDVEQPELAEPRGLHRADEDVPAAVLLGVEERVRHAERHRVAHVGGAEGVGVDEDRVGHGGDPSYRLIVNLPHAWPSPFDDRFLLTEQSSNAAVTPASRAAVPLRSHHDRRYSARDGDHRRDRRPGVSRRSRLPDRLALAVAADRGDPGRPRSGGNRGRRRAPARVRGVLAQRLRLGRRPRDARGDPRDRTPATSRSTSASTSRRAASSPPTRTPTR